MTIKILFTDVETYPARCIVWRTGKQIVSVDQLEESGGLLCWSGKWLRQTAITFMSKWAQGDKMIHTAHKLLARADAVVHYNGNSFDIKVYNAEFARLGLPPPAPAKQIDLYRVVKSNFQLPSYKLSHVLKYFGIGEKLRTGGLDLWKDVAQGSIVAQNKMRRYNIRDTRLLEPLYLKLRPWIKNHPNMNVYFDEDGNRHCGICRSKRLLSNGERATNTKTYTRYSCKDCGSWNFEINEQIRVGG